MLNFLRALRMWKLYIPLILNESKAKLFSQKHVYVNFIFSVVLYV